MPPLNSISLWVLVRGAWIRSPDVTIPGRRRLVYDGRRADSLSKRSRVPAGKLFSRMRIYPEPRDDPGSYRAQSGSRIGSKHDRRMIMRCNLVHALGLSISVFVGGLSLASPASAQSISVPPMHPAGRHTGHATTVEDLRQAHRLLVEADHDYDGHRARAAEAVHRAIRELEGRHHGRSISAAPTVTHKLATAKRPANHESQATSDAQLRKARADLQWALNHISGRHPKAAAHVKHAIREIDTALHIK